MVLVDAFDKRDTEQKEALWIIVRGFAEESEDGVGEEGEGEGGEGEETKMEVDGEETNMEVNEGGGEPKTEVDEELGVGPKGEVDEEVMVLARALRDIAYHVRNFGLDKARSLFLEADEPLLEAMVV